MSTATRTIRRWASAAKQRHGHRQAHRPTGRGGAMGTPGRGLAEAPPSLDQELNWVVSGGGAVGPTGDPSRTSIRSR